MTKIDKIKFSQDYELNKNPSQNDRNMSFCFGKTHKKYTLVCKKAQKDEKCALVNSIDQLSQDRYEHWMRTSKQSGGGELIPVNQLKTRLPQWVSKDVKKVSVFRFKGNKCRLIGVFDPANEIFDVIFVDYKLEVYDH